MKNILIVEDEKYARLGLRKMISECGVGYDEIFDCRNGEEALDLISQHHFDVVFTDIQMPRMDGIELITNIRSQGIDASIVVISGFGDFEYAVEALRNGALDYLLKPVKREKVAEVLAKIQNQIEQGRKKEFFTGLGYYLLGPPEAKSGGVEVSNEIKKIFDGSGKIVFACVGEAELPDLLSCRDFVNGFTVVLCDSNQYKEWEEELGVKNLVGTSRMIYSDKELRAAAAQAIEQAKMAFLRCPRELGEDGLAMPVFPSGITGSDIERYISKVATMGCRESIELIQAFFSARHLQGISSESYEGFLTQFLNSLKFNFQEELEKLGISLDGWSLYRHSPQSMEKEISSVLLQLNELCLLDEMDWKNREKILNSIEFVNRNYGRNINMAEAANRAGMNYTSFSTAFKSVTGETFSSYLRRVRIEKAKELLLDGDIRILEISVMVGYENEKQFMKVFKKVLGISPSQYRREKIKKRYSSDNKE